MRLIKIVTWTIGIILIASLILLAALPSLISAKWVKEEVVTLVNEQIPGSIKLKNIELSWFTNQRLQGLVLRDPDGENVVVVQEATARIALWDLFFDQFPVSSIILHSPAITIKEHSCGQNSLQRALGLVPKEGGDSTSNVSITIESTDEPDEPDEQCPELEKRNVIHTPLYGDVSIVDGSIRYTTNDEMEIALSNVNAKVSLARARTSGGRLSFAFDAQGQITEEGAPRYTTLHFEGEILQLVDKEGRLTNSDTISKMIFDLDGLPATALAKALPIDDSHRLKVATFIGDTMDLNVTVNTRGGNGTITADYNGNHSKLAMAGRAHDGVFTLDKPLRAEIVVTPELSRLILKDINPLLVSAIGSDAPIQLTIDSDGFSVPISPFDPTTAEVPKVTIDFGKMLLRNDGLLGGVISVLQSKKLERLPEVTLWFTPQYVSISNGVVNVARTDILLSKSFHMATWGTINLAKDKLKMTLGLSAQALKKAFGVKGLKDKQMLHIRITGSTVKPKLDASKAIAAIGTLVAQETAGDFGQVIGDLFSKAGVDLLGSDTPPPTTSPFPWEKDPSLNLIDTETPASTAKEKEKPENKLEKEIKKKAGKWIKKMFR